MSNLKSINVIFEQSQFNYTTSVSANASLNTIKEYFLNRFFPVNADVFPANEMEQREQCINFTLNIVTAPTQELCAVLLEGEDSQKYWVLLDTEHNCVLGYPGSNTPYAPAGALEAVSEIVKTGFAPNSKMIGYPVQNIQDNTYKLISTRGTQNV